MGNIYTKNLINNDTLTSLDLYGSVIRNADTLTKNKTMFFLEYVIRYRENLLTLLE
jgi:hypothetical protein